MNYNELQQLFHAEKVQPYHGYEVLDALKYLTELETLPTIVRESFYRQYEDAFQDMETVQVRDFTDKLFEHLNGNEDPIFSDVIRSTRLKDRTICHVQVTIPYFERVREYFKKIGRPIQVQSVFDIFDVRLDDGSSLNRDAIAYAKASKCKSFTVGRGYSKDTPWCVSGSHYMFSTEGSFYMPYNGFSAAMIPSIIDEFRSRYGSDPGADRISYVNRLLKGIEYYIGSDLYSKYRVLTAEDERMIDRETKNQMNEIWGK